MILVHSDRRLPSPRSSRSPLPAISPRLHLLHLLLPASPTFPPFGYFTSSWLPHSTFTKLAAFSPWFLTTNVYGTNGTDTTGRMYGQSGADVYAACGEGGFGRNPYGYRGGREQAREMLRSLSRRMPANHRSSRGVTLTVLQE